MNITIARRLLTVTALLETSAGLALLLSPPLVLALLLGASSDGPAVVVLSRVAAAALLSFGLGCWLARDEGSSRAVRGLVAAALFYNGATVAVLAYAAIGAGLFGVLLWPAVALHAALGGWCIACLWTRPANVTTVRVN